MKNNFYNHLLFQEYRVSAEALGLYRIAFALIYLLFIGVPSFSWLTEVPEYFFYPQRFSIARLLFEDIPSKAFLVALDLGILVTLVCILFGYKTTRSCLLLMVLLIIGYSLKFSLGKLGHAILLVVLPGLMAFSGWGKSFSLDSQKSEVSMESPSGYFPFLVAMVLGFAMFTSGWSKFTGGWLHPDRFGTFYYYSLHYYVLEDRGWLSPLMSNFSGSFVWKLMDYATVALEVLFLPAILNKRVLQVFCLVAVIFHFFTLWILNIAFINNLLVYLLFTRWEPIIAYLQKKQMLTSLRRFISIRSFFIVLAIALLQHLFFMFIANENLVRDMLISPISFFLLFSELDFRQVRVVFLFGLTALVVVGHFLSYLSPKQ